MASDAILKNTIEKEKIETDIKPMIKEMGGRLSVLQQELRKAKIPVIIAFEGFGTAGKGSVIGKVVLNLDPRGFQVYMTEEPNAYEDQKPFLNRFWLNIPKRGEMAIFNQSWYYHYKDKNKNEINVFERQLANDGYLLIKIFLHITKPEQSKRIAKLSEDKDMAFRVTKEEVKENEQYSKYLKKYNEMIRETNTKYAPWHVVPGMDKKQCLYEVLQILTEELETALKSKSKTAEDNKEQCHTGILPDMMNFPLINMPKLEDIDLQPSMKEDEYHAQLNYLQDKLNQLSYKLNRKKIPMILCYEGWDAAGKGGNIKRTAACFDSRIYDVTPIAAPDSNEIARHYLWRFQKYIPKAGEIAVFDRTWYGRVMVERIEGFCTKEEWTRAYNEINEFEKQLADWGAIIVKFWLQIDKEEQMVRFTDRQNTLEKQWKITDEDWRNREKWDEYETAVNDMLKYTSTSYAPWTVIESNCKRFARIKAIQTIIQAIEKRL